MIVSIELRERVGALFKRRPTTPWSHKEARVYAQIVKHYGLRLEDLELIERYYAFQRRRGDNGIHRRDLYTFLNNFAGELDRARAWKEQHSRTKFFVATGLMPDGGKPCCDEERQRIAQLAKQELQRFKKEFNHV